MRALVVAFLSLFILAACSENGTENSPLEASPAEFSASAPETIDWSLLIPAGAPRLGPAPKPALSHSEIPLQETGSPINSALDLRWVRLPGFVVPLEYDGNRVIEFLLVPYFGACIHVPPPPPNQLVFVHFEQGLELDSLETPYWVSGQMTTGGRNTEYATAGYVIEASTMALYDG